MSRNALVFQDVKKEYTSLHFLRHKKSLALGGISFTVKEGEIFGLLGPNGAGKSTAIKILLGFSKKSAGMIEVGGFDTEQNEYRHLLGYLPEIPFFNEHLTASETLYLSGRLSGQLSKKLKKQILVLLERVDLIHVKDRRISTFSKGMKQRLGMVNAIIHDPQILIFDEPMSGLDPLGRHQIKQLILDFKQSGKTIFFSSHILSDVEELCQSIGIINKGHLLYTGPLDTFLMDTTKLEDKFIQVISEDDNKHTQ